MKFHEVILGTLIQLSELGTMIAERRSLRLVMGIRIIYTRWALMVNLVSLWCLLNFRFSSSWCMRSWCFRGCGMHSLGKHSDQQSSRRTLTIKVFTAKLAPIFPFGIPEITLLKAVHPIWPTKWWTRFSNPGWRKTITISPFHNSMAWTLTSGLDVWKASKMVTICQDYYFYLHEVLHEGMIRWCP